MEYGIKELKSFLFGLPWFGKENYKLYRFPESSFSLLNLDMQRLSKHSAGAMLKFKAKTDIIAMETNSNLDDLMGDFSKHGQYGIDLYCDGDYHGYIELGGGNQHKWINVDGEKYHDYLIYFPTYSEVELVELALEMEEDDEEPILLESEKFSLPGKIVIYGSSITQGAFASRPGMAYSARIGRELNAEVVNLGFAGSGKGEHEVSSLISEISNVSLYIMDWGCNISAPEEVEMIRERYPYMIDKIHEKHPNTPILFISSQAFHSEKFDNEMKRSFKIIRDTTVENYNRAKKMGIKCDFINGLDILSHYQMDYTTDGAHCNDAGFSRYLKHIIPKARKLLDLATKYN